jgi:hypothetical protein
VSLRSLVRSLIPPATFDTVAQISHVECGLLVTIISSHWHVQGWFFAALVVYTAIKEFWWDPNHEAPDVRGNSLKDFLFQIGGGVAGLILTWLW